MVASPNGVAMRPIMRFSVVPKWVPFEIERPNPDDPNGEPIVVTLRAWDKREPHPAAIDIAVEAAVDVYREALYLHEQARQDAPGAVQIAPLEQASGEMHAGILCAVIEGLTPEDADVLTSASGPWEDILVTLGWWKSAEDQPVAPSDGAEDADDPEAPGELATTTGEYSPDSQQPTASIAGES